MQKAPAPAGAFFCTLPPLWPFSFFPVRWPGRGADGLPAQAFSGMRRNRIRSCGVSCEFFPEKAGTEDEGMMENVQNLQERPYVVCHMAMSLDGRVTGDFLRESRCASALQAYYRINRDYAAGAFACGRVTMEERFTHAFRPDLFRFREAVIPPMDHVADENASFFAVAFDRHGSLGWKGPRIEDDDPGYGGAHIIEVLCEGVPQACLAYLQEVGVSYIFAGKDDIDLPLALHKLKSIFGIRKLLLEGGSLLNGSFLRADLVDELSIVQVPVTGNAQDKSLFDRGVTAFFRLEEMERLEDGAAWLRYRRAR